MLYRVPRRYQITFPDRAAFVAAQAAEAPELFRVPLALPRRRSLLVEVPVGPAGLVPALQSEDRTLRYFAEEYGATIMDDYQYAMDQTPIFDASRFPGVERARATLDDVTGLIQADQCWRDTTGDRVVLAVVDTGIDGRNPEFPAARRAGGWAEGGRNPWMDERGHGTMCAAIAAGSRQGGGRYNGVAPTARLVSCRTSFFDSQLAAAYDYLLDGVEEDGWKVVATNSFGVRVGAPPPPPGSVFAQALDDAIRAGIAVVFSAGNYHQPTPGGTDPCAPTSIWGYKCRNDVLTVATCRLDHTMWEYSSRGPGEHAGEPGMGDKPDVTAPTPACGAVLYGDHIEVLPDGWGTSGAAPQAAGLAALLWSHQPELTCSQLFDIIRDTALPLGHGTFCEGRGMIQCRAALDRV